MTVLPCSSDAVCGPPCGMQTYRRPVVAGPQSLGGRARWRRREHEGEPRARAPDVVEAVQAELAPAGVLPQAQHVAAAEVTEPRLVQDRRVRKITFTGSRDVGEHICKLAGIKRVTMELGSNAPVIVMPDADLDKVAAAVASTGYANAGQVCISTQRVLASGKVYSDFLAALKPRVEGLKLGNQLDESVKIGPMIREKEAARVDDWIREAVTSGARVITGGTRQGAMYAPRARAGRRSSAPGSSRRRRRSARSRSRPPPPGPRSGDRRRP
ncbi:MAG: aldehyde dehydrogenase family protein [Candidatus Rokuibacteriota bacterium]|nr:MAG: aldehyde dehydrogenase family protein [Candidatus Rokubacteria bacterium]